MPIDEPKIIASCDAPGCDSISDEMPMRSLDRPGSYDTQDIPKRLARMGWRIEGEKTFCCDECAEHALLKREAAE